MKFTKGQSGNPSGRKKGKPNKMTPKVKEAFALAFEGIGGVPAFIAWAKKNPAEFYKLYARLIPVDVAMQGGVTLNVVTGVPT